MTQRRKIIFPPALTLEEMARMDFKTAWKEKEKYSPDSVSKAAAMYPEYIRDALGDEDQDVEHFIKWIDLGGVADAVQAWVDEGRGQRVKRTAGSASKAREALSELTGQIAINYILSRRVRSSDQDIFSALEELRKILSAENFSDPALEEGGKPGHRKKVESHCAVKAITDFFPDDYPVSKAARVFCKAYSYGSGGPFWRSESSVRVIMQNARKGRSKQPDFKRAYDQWRSGKNCKD